MDSKHSEELLKNVLTNADIYDIIRRQLKRRNIMVDKEKRVYVYFNLHKKCWSVRQSGKIVDHTNQVLLKDCRYLVGQAGREKVLKEKRKNVHAGVSGYLVDHVPNVPEYSSELTYNPYKNEAFVSKDDPSRIIEHSDYAFLECGNGWRILEAIWE